MNKVKKILCMIAIIFTMLLSLTGCGNSEEADELNRKKDQCSTQSDTYNKCSYSLWEARCVCKRR